jgi:hypothetical protein
MESALGSMPLAGLPDADTAIRKKIRANVSNLLIFFVLYK